MEFASEATWKPQNAKKRTDRVIASAPFALHGKTQETELIQNASLSVEQEQSKHAKDYTDEKNRVSRIIGGMQSELIESVKKQCASQLSEFQAAITAKEQIDTTPITLKELQDELKDIEKQIEKLGTGKVSGNYTTGIWSFTKRVSDKSEKAKQTEAPYR